MLVFIGISRLVRARAASRGDRRLVRTSLLTGLSAGTYSCRSVPEASGGMDGGALVKRETKGDTCEARLLVSGLGQRQQLHTSTSLYSRLWGWGQF